MPPSAFALLAGSTLALSAAASSGAAQDRAGEAFLARTGLRHAGEDASPGYTLVAPLRSREAYLLDLEGRVVHRWVGERPLGGAVELLADGSLLRCARAGENPAIEGGGQCGAVERVAWDGTLAWRFEWSSPSHLHHHDLAVLPNGNVVLISWEAKSRDEAIAAGRDPARVGEHGLWPDFLVEIEPSPPDGGRVVWEWHVWDHLVQDFDPARPGFGDVTRHPELLDVNAGYRVDAPVSLEERARLAEVERRMRALGYVDDEEAEELTRAAADRRASRADWLHVNSVDHHPELDLLLLSVRGLGEIWVIDHSTTTEEAAGHSGGRRGRGGDLLYRWGNPRTYGAPGEQRLFFQHDARWIASGAPGIGRILVFNNGGGRPGGSYSTVDEIEPPFDAQAGFRREPGAAFGPAELSWSYGAPVGEQHFFASFLSGAERLPNGNTLVCAGTEARVFELTRDGRIVWDWVSPFPGGDRRGAPPAPVPQGGERPGGRDAAEARDAGGLFRASRIPPGHPALAGRELVPLAGDPARPPSSPPPGRIPPSGGD